MPYDSQNMGRGQGPSRNASGRRGGAPSGGSRSRERVDLGGSYHGPRGTQQRSGSRGIRGRRGPSIQKGLGNGGYPLRSRSINFQGGRGRRSADRRMLILGALALVLIVLLVVGVSSCVKGCSNGGDQPAADQNQIDSRVAAGVTDELTNRFKTELDRNEKLAQIAANANAYDDTSLLELALDVPESIDFVANYPNAQKSGQAYSDAVSKGTAPELYDWDIRWGAVAYGEHPLAVSGSGPTAFSMAYMGLTGSADKTPADMAALASGQNFATGDSGTDGKPGTNRDPGTGSNPGSNRDPGIDSGSGIFGGIGLVGGTGSDGDSGTDSNTRTDGDPGTGEDSCADEDTGTGSLPDLRRR